ncbi:hypothetical protein K438DRAFT_156572 [Mycena galopus ATCC 62051]|nr:hypothetical protein K438DRAFT_156572 [Mycena galopus ATCC 62051]
MTQDTTLPIATPIPHHLATEFLDKAANNWPLWEKTVLSCLTIVGLEGYVVGAVPCPDPTVDPVGAMNWQSNDRAVVSFLVLKASPREQEYIAPYVAAGAKAVWDALVTRHFDATLQIRLLREAFSVRYGAEPPAVTSARIDALATRVLALGQINKTTLVSAVMVNAVQGDLENFANERRHALLLNTLNRRRSLRVQQSRLPSPPSRPNVRPSDMYCPLRSRLSSSLGQDQTRRNGRA